jgi:hypothetical protein
MQSPLPTSTGGDQTDLVTAHSCVIDEACSLPGAVGIMLGDGTFPPVVNYPTTSYLTAHLDAANSTATVILTWSRSLEQPQPPLSRITA